MLNVHAPQGRAGAKIRQRNLGDHNATRSLMQVGRVEADWPIEVDAIAFA